METVVVVGNPRLRSRTRHAAEMVTRRLTSQAPTEVIELAELGAALLDPASPAVASAKQVVLSADLLVVASPTYKATYTGLLKLFIEHFGAGELDGLPTVPVMLGAGSAHALAVELALKPLLVEVGCSCPTPGLYLLDSSYESDAVLDDWLTRASRVLPLGAA